MANLLDSILGNDAVKAQIDGAQNEVMARVGDFLKNGSKLSAAHTIALGLMQDSDPQVRARAAAAQEKYVQLKNRQEAMLAASQTILPKLQTLKSEASSIKVSNALAFASKAGPLLKEAANFAKDLLAQNSEVQTLSTLTEQLKGASRGSDMMPPLEYFTRPAQALVDRLGVAGTIILGVLTLGGLKIALTGSEKFRRNPRRGRKSL